MVNEQLVSVSFFLFANLQQDKLKTTMRYDWTMKVLPPDGSAVKNLPAKQEMLVQSLSQEDPLEKEMATHSSILAWRIPWIGEPGGLQSMGSQKSQRTLND